MRLRCSLCSERVGREGLEAHWKVDLAYAPFACRLCGVTFYSLSDAHQHFRYPDDTLHPQETKPQITEQRVAEVEERLRRLRAELTELSVEQPTQEPMAAEERQFEGESGFSKPQGPLHSPEADSEELPNVLDPEPPSRQDTAVTCGIMQADIKTTQPVQDSAAQKIFRGETKTLLLSGSNIATAIGATKTSAEVKPSPTAEPKALPKNACRLCKKVLMWSQDRAKHIGTAHVSPCAWLSCRICGDEWRAWASDAAAAKHLRLVHPSVPSPHSLPPSAVRDLRGSPGAQRDLELWMERCFGIAGALGDARADCQPTKQDLKGLAAFQAAAQQRSQRWREAQRLVCPFPWDKPGTTGFAAPSLHLVERQHQKVPSIPARLDCVECGQNVARAFSKDHAVFKHMRKPVHRCRHCPYEIFRWNDTSLHRDHLRRKHGSALSPGWMAQNFHTLKDEALCEEMNKVLKKCYPLYSWRVNDPSVGPNGAPAAARREFWKANAKDSPMTRYTRTATKACLLCSLKVTETEEKNHVMLEHLDEGRAFRCRHCDRTSPYWSGDFKQLQTHMNDHHPGTGHWKKEVIDLRPELMATLNAILPKCFGEDAKLVVLSKLLGFNH